MECSICYDAITVETGKTVMACGHEFHFRCMASWFGTQCDKELPENCPCCRHVAGPLECLPECEEHENLDSDDESYESESGGESEASLAAWARATEGSLAPATAEATRAAESTITLTPMQFSTIRNMLDFQGDIDAVNTPLTRDEIEHMFNHAFRDDEWLSITQHYGAVNEGGFLVTRSSFNHLYASLGMPPVSDNFWYSRCTLTSQTITVTRSLLNEIRVFDDNEWQEIERIYCSMPIPQLCYLRGSRDADDSAGYENRALYVTRRQLNEIYTSLNVEPRVDFVWLGSTTRLDRDELEYALAPPTETQRPYQMADEAWAPILEKYRLFDEPAAEAPILNVAAAREISLTREQLDEVLRFNGGSGVDDALWDVVADKNFHYAYLKEIIEANGGEFFGVDWAMAWSKYGPNSLQKIFLSREQLDQIIRSKGGDGLDDNHAYKSILTRDCLNMMLSANHCAEVSSLEWADLYSRYSSQLHHEADIFLPSPIKITWQRVSETRWERTVVMNPENDIWEGDTLQLTTPPDSLVTTLEKAAVKFQAIWRGKKQRGIFGAARAMHRILTCQ